MWKVLTTLNLTAFLSLTAVGGYLIGISMLDRRSDVWKEWGLQDISTVHDPFKKGKKGWTIVGGCLGIAVISKLILLKKKEEDNESMLSRLYPYSVALFFWGVILIIASGIANQLACASSEHTDCE
jgi:hypothetical protein